ncbi:hypothetical protein WMF31_22915 [Sorangium sp. So ce1036]|uniref:RCC1 domain-containing protein n=1 Tax=Sorangium TaxID=39643 RepID=UPI0013ECFF44|nr:hypothetical protein [Sorangium cellulosum]
MSTGLGCVVEEDAEVPEPVGSVQELLSVAVALDMGPYNGCVALTDGTAYCWGNNAGELGDGTTSPVQVAGLTNIVDVAGAYAHSCALDSAGTVYCWGSNGYGKLGDGTRTAHYTAAAVTGVSNAVDVVTGSEHSCALLSSGSVTCWGQDLHLQLGDLNNATDSPSPVTVSGLTDAVAISAGNQYTCALRSTGGVSCWGENFIGQLGDGTTTKRSTPVSVTGITDAVALAAGGQHACAILSDSTVKCWGSNSQGKLGTGSTTPTHSTTPVSVSGISDAVQISAGISHTCVVRTGGAVSCWGVNGNRQLGDGSVTNRSSPAAVSALSDSATVVQAGAVSTCALVSGGSVKCWGSDLDGQLGDGPTVSSGSLTAVTVALP